MSFDLNKWYEGKTDSNSIYYYKGSVENENVTILLATVEKMLDGKDLPPKNSRKIFNILVELVQNLHHHGVVPGDMEGEYSKFGILLLKEDGEKHRINSGNFIKAEAVPMLKERLDQINALSLQEARELYRMILNNNQYSEKGGGGLGIIDIARKSGNKMEYDFFEYNSEYLFLSIEVTV
ncbi:MAG: SiaB family protein kinase [Marinifilaceae bacterium]|jgi:hypothetical protein|nr:SiaB family protein kinase [Marinifilaceae bacterium]